MDKNMLLLTSVLVYVPAGTTVKTDPHSYIEQVSKTFTKFQAKQP